MEYVLTTNSLKKCYGNHSALNELTMSIPKGAIYGFVGRNGAGKTTLIRLICGLQKPDAGEYSIFGISNKQKEISVSRRRMGALVEAPSVYLDMTVEENLQIQYRVLGLPSVNGISDLLKLTGLTDFADEKAKRLSPGVRQRLGIALALAGDPDFLILDEPANGLDPQGIIEIRELILKLNQERGTTVLISNHILDELSRVATHFGFIDRGQILKEISAEELKNVCRKCLTLRVSEPKALAPVLEEMGLEYTILPDNQADIFGEPSITALTSKLYEAHCEVLSLTKREESLENYYLSLLGGKLHE